MKKIYIILFVFIFSVLSFSSKGNYDLVKYRQDVLKYALAQTGKKYSQKTRMDLNSFDCSSLVDRASQFANMNSITGQDTRKWSGTTQTMKSNVSNINYNDIKSGDTLHFGTHVGIVVENYGNGKIKMIHAANSKRGVVIDTINIADKSSHYGKKYKGTISAVQVLKNNGYTPINENGEIVIPPTPIGIENIVGEQYKNLDYGINNRLDFDRIAEIFSRIIQNSLNKFSKIGIWILMIMFSIQVTWDSIHAINDENIKGFIQGTLIKKTLTYVFYSVIMMSIYNGNLLKMSMNISYGILRLLTGNENQIMKLNSIFDYKEQLLIEMYRTFETIWTLKSAIPTELAKDLIISIVLIVLILLIHIAFFFIIFDLLKLLIGFQLTLPFSTILLPMGMTNATKGVYNIGKSLSMIINFIVKLVAVNFLAFIGIKTIVENNLFINSIENIGSVTEIVQGDFIKYIIILYIMYTLTHKTEISF